MVHPSRGPGHEGFPPDLNPELPRIAPANLARAESVRRVRMFQRLWRDQRGASLIDYAILAALITVLVVVAVAVAGSWLYSMWVRLLSLLG
jgi:Flp pilus assembly pilin Flp